jgi:hypothetical protein
MRNNDALPEPESTGDACAPTPFDDTLRLVLVKYGQRYVFRYEAGGEAQVLHRIVEMVRDPDTDLDWFDAAVLSHQMGQRMSEQLEDLIKP